MKNSIIAMLAAGMLSAGCTSFADGPCCACKGAAGRWAIQKPGAFWLGICNKDGKPDIYKLYTLYQKTTGLCTDTRKIQEGCMFLALKGENFDGNDFLTQALEKGAAYVISDNKQKASAAKKKFPKKVIVVDNSLKDTRLWQLKAT